MNKKKCFALLLSGCLTLGLLSGCGGSSTPPAGDNGGSGADGAGAPAADTRTLTLASTLGSNTSIIQVSNDMSAAVKEATGGAIDIQTFPDSTLGGQVDFLEGVSMGTVDMCIIAAGALEDFYDQYALYSVPFLFRDAEHTYQFFQSEASQAINDEFLNRTGMRVIGLFNEGFRQVWTKGKAVRSLADFSGLKLRVPDVTLYVNMFTALGCSTQVLPVGDLYTGLQTGLVEGMELPIGSVYGASTYEQVDYCTMTNHIGGAMMLLVNESVWQSLSDEQRAAVLENVEIASAQDRQNLVELNDGYVSDITESGVEFIELTDEARAEMVEAMNSVVSELYGDVLDSSLLESIRSMS